MTVLKKPKILPCECKICGAVFHPKWRNLTMSSRLAKEEVHCPMCKAINYVQFEKGGAE